MDERTWLSNGGGQDPGKFSRHRTDDSLAFVQRGQIDTLRLARQRIQVPVIISNLDLVVLGDESHDDRLDTTSFALVVRTGSFATRVQRERVVRLKMYGPFNHGSLIAGAWRWGNQLSRGWLERVRRIQLDLR